MTSGTMPSVIVDTGPLVAFLDATDRNHAWVKNRIAKMRYPLLMCEAVLTEAMHLLRRLSAAHDELFGLVEDGVLAVTFHLSEHAPTVRALLRKYRDRPMSLADACIVRMAEVHEGAAVFTLDTDFTVYRKNGRAPIDLISPSTS
jgi:predicted nucleic acid-binding protein